MAVAYSPEKMASIRKDLKRAAASFARSDGMRGTNVDRIVEAAGSSKATFYKLYPSKELLFFDLLEDWHDEIYGKAAEMLAAHTDLPPEERMYRVVMEMFRLIEAHDVMSFAARELPQILAKVPQEVLAAHYHSDRQHILALVRESGISFAVPHEAVASVIYTLFLSLIHRREVGDQYLPAIEILARGACRAVLTAPEPSRPADWR